MTALDRDGKIRPLTRPQRKTAEGFTVAYEQEKAETDFTYQQGIKEGKRIERLNQEALVAQIDQLAAQVRAVTPVSHRVTARDIVQVLKAIEKVLK